LAPSSSYWAGRLIGPIAALALLGACQPAPTPIPPLSGAIHLGVTGTFESLEPVQAQSRAERTLHGLLYEGLLAFDPSLRPVPVLADGQPEASPDGLAWTVRCRQDVTFHDGEPFTCADALARLESLRANAAVIASNQGDPTTLRALLDRIASVTLVDDHTLTITLSEPFSYLPEALSHPAAAIIHPDGVGTGPYMLASLSETEATLQANPAYRDAPLPAETVVLATLPGDVASGERITGLGTRYDAIDVAPTDDLPEGADLLTAPGVTAVMLLFDPDDPVASNPGVRRAIGAVVDRARLVEQAYDGRARPALSLVTLTDIETAEMVPTTPSVTAAREIQAEAGWPDGFGLTLFVAHAAPQGEVLGTALMNQLGALYIDGATAPLDPVEMPPAFSLAARAFPDSYVALSWLVGEDGPAAGDALLRQMLDEARAAPTSPEREAALAAAREHLSETLPLIPLVAPDACALAAPGSAHVRASPFGWLEIAIR
jgi:glutathione transport system substrate-binding protein